VITVGAKRLQPVALEVRILTTDVIWLGESAYASTRSEPILASTNSATRLTQDQEDDADYQHNNADRHQNADAQDPAQDQQDETKNNHVLLLGC
jgi:hypothetical protein